MAVDSITAAPTIRSRSRAPGVVAVLVLAFAWLALPGTRPLYEPDEGRYAEIPREMLAGGDWLLPHLDGLLYFEKPPLQYWLTAATMRVFGENEFAARLVPALAGLGCLALVYLLGRQLWGARAGTRAAVLLAGATLFTLLAHQLTLDMLLTFWLTLALACFVRAQQLRTQPDSNRRWMLGCWAGMAAAVMTKGLIGALIPAMTMIVYSVLQRDFRLYDRLNLRWGLPLFAALAAPWFVLASRANGAFFEFFFVREHFERYLTPIESRVQPWWFFLLVLVVGLLPWSLHMLESLLRDGRGRVGRGQFDPVRLLWVWAAFTLLFFSLSDSKLIPYVLPAVPALALLCARHEPAAQPRLLAAGTGITLAAAVAILVMIAAGLLRPGASQALRVVRAFATPLAGMALVLASMSVVAFWLQRRGRSAGALIAVCAGWGIATGILLPGSAAGDPLFSRQALARELKVNAGASDPVFSVGVYDQTLAFYARRTVIPVAYRGELDLGLSQAPGNGVDRVADFAERWRRLPAAYAIVPPKTLEGLAAGGLPYRELDRDATRVLISRR